MDNTTEHKRALQDVEEHPQDTDEKHPPEASKTAATAVAQAHDFFRQFTKDDSLAKLGFPAFTADDFFSTKADDNSPAGDKKKAGGPVVEEKEGGEAKSDKTKEAAEKGSTAQSREELNEIVKKNFTDEKQQKQVLADLDKFEARAGNEGISAIDRDHVFLQLGRVLKEAGEGNKFFKASEVRGLVADVARHCAEPGSVNQGIGPTCTAAALEAAMYKKEPGAVAEMIADVTISGEYKTKDGTVIKPAEKNLKPGKHDEAGAEFSRSGANQIAQMTMLNAYWNRQDSIDAREKAETGKKGKIFYEEDHPTEFSGDSHTRLMDRSKSPPVPFSEQYTYSDPTSPDFPITELRPIPAPRMSIGNIRDIYDQMRGNKGELTLVNKFEDPRNKTPKTLEEFKKLMENAAGGKDGASMPIVMGVFAHVEPFKSDLSVFNKGKDKTDEKKDVSSMHSHHAVAIFDYNPKTGLVTVENQWGPSVDHTGKEGSKKQISVEQLFKAFTGSEGTKDGKPAKEEKKQTPDDYINGQRKFVEQLKGEGDVDPKLIFGETMKLASYLRHWGRKDEMTKIVGPLTEDFLKQPGTLKNQVDIASRLLDFNTEPKDREKILAKLDKQFDDQLGKGTVTRESLQNARTLMGLHKKSEDPKGAASIVDRIMVQTMKDAGSIDFKRKGNPVEDVISAIEFMKDNGQEKKAKETLNALLATVRKEEKPDQYDRLLNNVKSSIASRYIEFGDKETGRKLTQELQEIFDKSKDKAKDPKDYTAAHLRDLYASLGDFKKMSRAVDDILQQLADEPTGGKDQKPTGMDHPSMASPLRVHAELFFEHKQFEKAAELYEKAYKIQQREKGKDPREFNEYQSIATTLAKTYEELGRKEDAQKIRKEAELDKPRRRR
ncbi:MAG: hypothetical protein K2W95_19535 [Candidatus Obscuribacterales bacterium]|nr:hypothetical protein [Candidatus Obscuribacterales bacterium]